ncbi:Uncharacterized conserved protein, DUF924 family [Parasphingorhabdus marina DSM 22363]|uniref:Uncharacterized conserved protein, DUF924 family n=1 Tax=Parasphingorhabdus marina DSM 22363 TaxID=1123272 RepID=A0A1N6H4R4_9SPHN|nr:DUF924 family protein [Parasphingorhabdus marina]SIO14780.1 Uncharacterized conserved protein, DUF924 family [Parasphingorhabdus marina DSM 22363]
MTWQPDILRFWFSELAPKDWWNKNESVDNLCKERFFELWQEQKSRVADDFLTSADDALAAVILFDQIPRNIFRGSADAYSTDHLAVQIADKAVDQELDDKLSEDQRSFLYMPFMHSEDLQDQNRSVMLFTKLGSNEKFANSHRDVIAKFGRFPHRNEVLGRAMRPGEQEAIDGGAGW